MAKANPGRPRDAALDQRILDAALEAVREYGLRGATIDEIARRAGVSKPTIYGRWPSKDELLRVALSQLRTADQARSQSDPRSDCIAALSSITAEPGARNVLGALFAEVAPLVAPRRERCEAAIARAIAGRELSSKTDVSVAVDLLVGPVLYERFVARAEQANLPIAVVDAVWRAFAPGGKGA